MLNIGSKKIVISQNISLKTLQSRRRLEGLIKQREIELSCDTSTGQYQSSYQTFPLIMFIASLLYLFHVSTCVVCFYVLLKLEWFKAWLLAPFWAFIIFSCFVSHLFLFLLKHMCLTLAPYFWTSHCAS